MSVPCQIYIYVCKQKPDIHRCISSNRDRLGINAEILFIFRTVQRLTSMRVPTTTFSRSDHALENALTIWMGVHCCTDEILISDVNSHKTSLANIYMCLKMYCYKCAC